MNRNKTKYTITVIFENFTEKTFIRYFKYETKLNNFFEKLNQKYGSENIKMIMA